MDDPLATPMTHNDRTVTYTCVPRRESWLITFLAATDREGYSDVLKALRSRSPDRFDSAVRSFRRAVANSDIDAIRFSIGHDIPEHTTVILKPDSREHADRILEDLGRYLPTESTVVPWDRIHTQTLAIRDALNATPDGPVPSFGVSAIIETDAGYRQAPTSWLATHLDDPDEAPAGPRDSADLAAGTDTDPSSDASLPE